MSEPELTGYPDENRYAQWGDFVIRSSEHFEGMTGAGVGKTALMASMTTLVAAIAHPEWARAWAEGILADAPELADLIRGASGDWVQSLPIAIAVPVPWAPDFEL